MASFPNDAQESVSVKALTAADVPVFLELIQALADYEKLPGPDAGAQERLARDATCDPPRFWVLLAEQAGRAVGYAVYFETYSTFLACPTLYLEDLFVLGAERGHGAGHALLREVAREAVLLGCGRMEWMVLHWNSSAMGFYTRLGAAPLEEWQPYRMTVEQFTSLAEGC